MTVDFLCLQWYRTSEASVASAARTSRVTSRCPRRRARLEGRGGGPAALWPKSRPRGRPFGPGSHKLDHLISTAVRCQACFEGTFEPAFGPQNTGLRAEDSGRRLSVGSGPLAGVITQPTGLNPQSQEIIPNEEASSRTARSAGTNRRRSRRFYLLARHSISSPSGGA